MINEEKEIIESISSMTKRQKLQCISDISANIQVLKNIVAASNAYKRDMLDTKTSALVRQSMHQHDQEIIYLNDKLNLLMGSLK